MPVFVEQNGQPLFDYRDIVMIIIDAVLAAFQKVIGPLIVSEIFEAQVYIHLHNIINYLGLQVPIIAQQRANPHLFLQALLKRQITFLNNFD